MSEAAHAAADRKRAAPSHGASPTAPAVDREVDAPTAGVPSIPERVLADPRLSSSANQAQRVRLLQRLQHGYGNGHVARVLQRVQHDPQAHAQSSTLQREVADCPAPPLEKPKLEPAEDPKFAQVQGKIKQVATAEKKHTPPKAKVAEAQGAAQPPTNDVASQAAAAQVDTMAAQKPGTFDKQAFVAAVRIAIEAASPKNLEEADDFKSSGKAEQVKDQVGGLVKGGKETSQQAIKQSTEAPPDPSKATPKPVTAMPQEQPGKPPSDVGAAGAMPSPKSGAEVSLANGPCQVNNQMAEANVTEEQLKKSNEPEFQDAVDSKKKAEEQAQTAPQEYRAQEQETLQKEKAEAARGASASLSAMHATKAGTAGKVGNDKAAAKAKDEAARAQVAKQIEDIYNHAKTDVTKILGDLDPLVDKTFTEGEESARNEFTTYVKTKTDAYKEDRYSGVLGWGRWVRDKFKTNPELNRIIDDGRAKYMAKMDAVISNVADVIGRELTRAKDRIAQGRQEVKEYVNKLPKDLKQVGAEGLEKIEGQFDQLESDVKDKQEGLVQNLAQKYTAARDALDEEANKMKEENKGLVDKAKDAVVGVIQTILKLKDMLLGVLAKAASEIGKIIKDPIGFLGNLVNAIKTGLNQFVSNIGTHLKKALMGWLFGALGEAGIQLPESFDLKGILSLILQVLGLTYDNIRGIAVNLVGEKVVAAAEGTVKVLITLVKEGPAGLWEWIKDKIAEINIKDMVIGAIKDFVITKIITAGITWLIGFLNPAAAFIKACKMIYDIIMFFIERGSQIMEFVNSVLDGIGAIAAGNIGSAANLVESSLAKILPLAISFLAAALGVGGIADKIKEIIEKIRAPITKVVTAVLGPILKPLKKLYDKGEKWVKGKLAQGKAWLKGKVDKGKAWAKGKLGVGDSPEEKQQRLTKGMSAAVTALNKFSGKKVGDTVLKPILAAIKFRYQMAALQPVKQGDVWGVHGEVNPTDDKTTQAQVGSSNKDDGEYQALKKQSGELLSPLDKKLEHVKKEDLTKAWQELNSQRDAIVKTADADATQQPQAIAELRTIIAKTKALDAKIKDAGRIVNGTFGGDSDVKETPDAQITRDYTLTFWTTLAEEKGSPRKEWGIVMIPVDPTTKRPVGQPTASMVLENRIELEGEPVKIKIAGQSFTNIALDYAIKKCAAKFGEEPALEASLTAKNLHVFQVAFANYFWSQGMGMAAACQAAIADTSAGKARIAKGYTVFDAKPGPLTKMDITLGDEKKNLAVPSSLNFVATKPKA